eukprot:m.173041 g.173041  ORF g.173041 m.173041 type:complete len:75 (+) comp16523_c0_seq13:2297-2521(+)
MERSSGWLCGAYVKGSSRLFCQLSCRRCLGDGQVSLTSNTNTVHLEHDPNNFFWLASSVSSSPLCLRHFCCSCS